MRLRSQLLDALYLNWAVPVAALPPAPRPLRYQTSSAAGDAAPAPGAGPAPEMAFVSAILFRHHGVHLPHLPFVRLSYPQANVRLYVLDADHVPSVLFVDMLMPWWVGPAVQVVADAPTSAARFRYPSPSADPAAAEWSWRVRQSLDGRGVLDVTGRRGGGMALTSGRTSLGSWSETVRFFRERPRGYVLSGGAHTGDRLRRVDAEHPPVDVWPMSVEVADDSLLHALLPLAGDGAEAGNGHGGGVAGPAWAGLHSAWLCPRIPFAFDVGIVPHARLDLDREMDATLPQPASTRDRLPQSAARGRVDPSGARGSLAEPSPRPRLPRAAAL